jgi:hypothetical protein
MQQLASKPHSNPSPSNRLEPLLEPTPNSKQNQQPAAGKREHLGGGPFIHIIMRMFEFTHPTGYPL